MGNPGAIISPAPVAAGAFAPVNASYVVMALDATLTAERVLTAGAGITVTDGGAGGAVTIAASQSAGPWDTTGTDVHLDTTTQDVIVGALPSLAKFTVRQDVETSGSPTALVVVGGAHTTLAAGVEAITVNYDLSATVQYATGAIATQRAMVVQAPTYAFAGASTITTAATVAITGAPAAGVNATITIALSLWVQAGLARFDGNTQTPIVIGSAAAGGGLTLRATSNVTDGDIIFETDPTTERVRIPSGGGLAVGRTSLLVATDIAGFEKNQNAETAFRVINTTSGPVAEATVSCRVGGSGRTVVMGHTTGGFTPLNGKLANEAFISTGFGASAPVSLAIISAAAVPIRFLTNRLERMRILGASNTLQGNAGLTIEGGAAAGNDLTLSSTAHGTKGSIFLGTASAYDEVNDRLGIGQTVPTAELDLVQQINTSGSPTMLLATGAAHTTLTASVEAITVNFDLSATVQYATGALALQRAMVVQAPTYAFVGASTLAQTATLAITGAPIAGVNATLTEALALFSQGGGNRFEDWTALSADSPAQIVANQNDYNPGASSYFRMSTDALRTISGFAPTGGNRDGRLMTIVNVGAQIIRLLNQDVGSAAANRIITSTGGSIDIGADGAAILRYDATDSRWRCIA